MFALYPIPIRTCRQALYGDIETAVGFLASARVRRNEISSAVPPSLVLRILTSSSSVIFPLPRMSLRLSPVFISRVFTPVALAASICAMRVPVFFLLFFALLLQGIECSSDPLPFIRTKIDLV